MTTPTPAPIDDRTPAPKNTAALVALILGIVAIVCSVVPFASYVAWLIGIVAIVLGIIGLTRAAARGRKGSSIVGLVLGAVAVILSIVLSIVYTVLFFFAAVSHVTGTDGFPSGFPTDLPSDFPTDLESILPTDPTGSLPTASPTAGQRSVTFRVTGSGTADSIVAVVLGGAGSGQEQDSDVDLPWSKTVPVADGSSTTIYSLVAKGGSGGGTITCEIEADGKVVSKHSESGANAVVACSGAAGAD